METNSRADLNYMRELLAMIEEEVRRCRLNLSLKPMVKSPGTERLNLKCDVLV